MGSGGVHLEYLLPVIGHIDGLNWVCTRPSAVVILLCVRLDRFAVQSAFLPCGACCWAGSRGFDSLGSPPRRLDMDGREHFEASSTGGDGGG